MLRHMGLYDHAANIESAALKVGDQRQCMLGTNLVLTLLQTIAEGTRISQSLSVLLSFNHAHARV